MALTRRTQSRRLAKLTLACRNDSFAASDTRRREGSAADPGRLEHALAQFRSPGDVRGPQQWAAVREGFREQRNRKPCRVRTWSSRCDGNDAARDQRRDVHYYRRHFTLNLWQNLLSKATVLRLP